MEPANCRSYRELLGLSTGWIGATRALQLADPDGHRLQLLQG